LYSIFAALAQHLCSFREACSQQDHSVSAALYSHVISIIPMMLAALFTASLQLFAAFV
jgi:hypothetical protein